MMNDLDDLMDFAVRTARDAGDVTLRHFGTAAVQFKGDGSELTAADLASEAYIRAALAEAFPDDGVIGEEEAERPSRSGRRWIIDPIDGTRSFASGVPLYCVLLALEAEGRPVVGCAHFPAIGQTLVAGVGAGAWVNGQRVRVSECDDLAAARLVTSGMEYWRDTPTHAAGFDRLVRATRTARTWGDGFGYYLVATGRAEIFCDPICGQYYDYAPFSVILPEAGGRFSQFDGGPIGPQTNSIASNALLHDRAAAIILGR
jgi:histidinol-phosphatase